MSPPNSSTSPAIDDVTETLKPIVAKYKIPALAAAVVHEGRTLAQGAAGVRKWGDPTPVTVQDQFHLGSCTKAMTAALVARLVETGKLRWETTIGEGLPRLKSRIHPKYHPVTLVQLLAHRGGCPGETAPKGKSLLDVHQLPGSIVVQRAKYVEWILAEPPAYEPGSRFEYSNAGYTVVGAVAEEATGRPWEELIREFVFEPLGMATAGFGAMGTPGKVDQPWQHQAGWFRTTPVEPGPRSDNPPAIGPAGRVHASIGDWAKFVAAQMPPENVTTPFLSKESLARLQNPEPNHDYVGGWVVVNRKWADGKTLTHAGSNTMNFCVAWLAPKRRFGVVVATNIAGRSAERACDDTAGALILRYLKR